MNSISRYAIFIAFVLSGFIGVIYLSIWTYYFELFLDYQRSARAIALSIFAVGSGIGSWFISRNIKRAYNPFLYFSECHLTIAISSLFFHWLYISLIDSNYSPSNLTHLNKLAFCIILILPASLSFGASLPLLHQSFSYCKSHTHKNTTLKCFINLFLGAAIGALTVNIILFQHTGTIAGLYFMSAINIFIAIYSFIVFKLKIRCNKLIETSAFSDKKSVSRVTCILALVTIITLFVYDSAWKQILSLMLGATFQSQGIISFSLFLALSMGLLFGQAKTKNKALVKKFLIYSEYTIAFSALLSLLASMLLFDLTSNLFQLIDHRVDRGYFIYTLFTAFCALIVIFPTTFFIGIALSIFLNIDNAKNKSNPFGQVYLLCTFWGVIGLSFSYGISLVLANANYQILFATVINTFLGIALTREQRKKYKKINLNKHIFLCLIAIGFICLLIGLPFVSHTPIYIPSLVKENKSEIIFSTQRLERNIEVLETTAFDKKKSKHIIRTLFKSGIPNTSVVMSKEGYTRDEVTRVLASAIPLLLKPDATHAAKIGLETGLTTHVALSSSKLISLETIELEENQVKSAIRFLPRNELALTDSRSHIILGSPRQFFPLQSHKYDFIVSTEINVSERSNLNLFSNDFYQDIKLSLKSDGVFSLWLDLSNTSAHTISSVITTLEQVFPFYSLYLATPSNLIIIASTHDQELNINYLKPQASLLHELKRVGISNTSQIASRLVLTEKTLSPMLASIDAPVNTNYHPTLNFILARDPFNSNNSSHFINPSISGISYLAMINPEMNESNFEADRLHPFYDVYNTINLLFSTMKPDISKMVNSKDNFEAHRVFSSPENYCGKSALKEQLWQESMVSLAKVIHPNAPLSKRRMFSQSKHQKTCHELSSLIATKLLIHLQVYVAESDWENSFKTSWRILDEYLKEPDINNNAVNYALNNFLLSSLLLSNEQLSSDYLEENEDYFQFVRDNTTQWLLTLINQTSS